MVESELKTNDISYSQNSEADLSASGESSEYLVTFVVPCYNSADFMRRCVDSLLPALDTCEVLLINDGSSDDTSKIAHEYADKHENIKAIDQENANWGGVFNRGLSEAKGRYFKIVDSDDYLFEEGLLVVLAALQESVSADLEPDLLITNYVYDHISDNSRRRIQYKKFFPRNRVFTWPEMGKPGADQFIMIHAAWYKTSILRESELLLPEGVSYMDSLVVLHPLPFVKTLMYLDIDTYNYVIGREGQSVDIEVVKRQIDQQLMASRLAIDDVDYADIQSREPHQASLMMGYISCMMVVSTIYLFKIGTEEALRKNEELWTYMEEQNPVLYRYIRKSMAGIANRRTRIGRFLACLTYEFVNLFYKFA